jgi:hypothetical protein
MDENKISLVNKKKMKNTQANLWQSQSTNTMLTLKHYETQYLNQYSNWHWTG